MIQSDKTDSIIMNIKNYLSKTVTFLLKRIAELFGILLVVTSILLLVSLISYSPDDPNFIFPENKIINNYLGHRGSYISDIFFQSVGLIALLIPFSIFFTGISIIINKKIILIIENTFFIILYTILGVLFFTKYHQETYWLTINGNNGFVGKIFEDTFIYNILSNFEKVSYFSLILFIFIIFLLSTNFKVVYFNYLLKTIIKKKKLLKTLIYLQKITSKITMKVQKRMI